MVTSIPSNNTDSSNDQQSSPSSRVTSVCHFAFDLLDCIKEFNLEHPDIKPISLRVGIHSGPVVAGVVGTKRFLYDIWGDTVNIASRMESTGEPGRIQTTKEFLSLLPPSNDEFGYESRGVIPIKGKGELETVFLTRDQHRNKRKREDEGTEEGTAAR